MLQEIEQLFGLQEDEALGVLYASEDALPNMDIDSGDKGLHKEFEEKGLQQSLVDTLVLSKNKEPQVSLPPLTPFVATSIRASSSIASYGGWVPHSTMPRQTKSGRLRAVTILDRLVLSVSTCSQCQ